MTVSFQNKLGLGGWTVQGSSTYGKSKLVLGCGRTGLNNDGVTYLLNLQEVTASGEASENAFTIHRLPQNVHCHQETNGWSKETDTSIRTSIDRDNSLHASYTRIV